MKEAPEPGALSTSGAPTSVAIDASGFLMAVTIPDLDAVDLFLLDLDGGMTAAGSSTLGGDGPTDIVFSSAVQ